VLRREVHERDEVRVVLHDGQARAEPREGARGPHVRRAVLRGVCAVEIE
jgi:hypothetical protein